jgi:hypothetical protein
MENQTDPFYQPDEYNRWTGFKIGIKIIATV